MLHSPVYGVYFYKNPKQIEFSSFKDFIQPRQQKEWCLLWGSRGKQGLLAQGLALTGSLGDLAPPNFLPVEHRDGIGNPQQLLQYPRSLSNLTGQAGNRSPLSKSPPSGAVRRNALLRPRTYGERKLPGRRWWASLFACPPSCWPWNRARTQTRTGMPFGWVICLAILLC